MNEIEPIFVKQNDTKNTIKAVLYDKNRKPVDVTDAKVRFLMSKGGEIRVDNEAIITDAKNGVVIYPFSEGDLQESGTHQAEFEVTYEDFRIETFPTINYIPIIVMKDLG